MEHLQNTPRTCGPVLRLGLHEVTHIRTPVTSLRGFKATFGIQDHSTSSISNKPGKDTRIGSHSYSSSSGRTSQFVCRASVANAQEVAGWFFGPPSFKPSKLSVAFLPGISPGLPLPSSPRRYTLTHNDITGALRLSVGPWYNAEQVSGWYVKLIRDEVLAEWKSGPGGANPSLHIYCHVSGEESWLAPPVLRSYIFRREMPLVLDVIGYADRDLLAANPQLSRASVFVHLTSHIDALNCTVEWGQLGVRQSWRAEPNTAQLLWQALGGIVESQVDPVEQRGLERSEAVAGITALAEKLIVDRLVGADNHEEGSRELPGSRREAPGCRPGLTLDAMDQNGRAGPASTLGTPPLREDVVLTSGEGPVEEAGSSGKESVEGGCLAIDEGSEKGDVDRGAGAIVVGPLPQHLVVGEGVIEAGFGNGGISGEGSNGRPVNGRERGELPLSMTRWSEVPERSNRLRHRASL